MKVIACYSIKGGVGKTATAVNLAHAAATSGYRTLLVDLDPQAAATFYFRIKAPEEKKGPRWFKMGQDLQQAIRGSDYPRLDLLPADLGYRDSEVMLAGMKRSDKQLRKRLKEVADEYDMVLIDSPANIGLLSENIFRAADVVTVPVIPTTLSERTLRLLLHFFAKQKLDVDRLLPFFSMVQPHKRLHADTMTRLRAEFPQLLQSTIPFTVDIENMGVLREPVLAYAPRRPAGEAYRALWLELLGRLIPRQE